MVLKKGDLCAEFFYELKILNEFCIPQWILHNGLIIQDGSIKKSLKR